MPPWRTFDNLFDDAGLFGPSSRPMADALAAHERARRSPFARAVGPFLCPLHRLEELDACVASGAPRPPRLGIVAPPGGLPTGAAWRRAATRPGVVQIEAFLGTDLSRVDGRVIRYLELPHHGDVPPALDAITAAGARAKVRCGGLTRDSVPTAAWLARVLVGCAQRGLLLKATAGLHAPYQRRGPDGHRHGIVNVLAAAAAAEEGAPVSTVSQILAAEADEGGELVRKAARGRGVIAAIGCWSIDALMGDLAPWVP